MIVIQSILCFSISLIRIKNARIVYNICILKMFVSLTKLRTLILLLVVRNTRGWIKAVNTI